MGPVAHACCGVGVVTSVIATTGQSMPHDNSLSLAVRLIMSRSVICFRASNKLLLILSAPTDNNAEACCSCKLPVNNARRGRLMADRPDQRRRAACKRACAVAPPPRGGHVPARREDGSRGNRARDGGAAPLLLPPRCAAWRSETRGGQAAA